MYDDKNSSFGTNEMPQGNKCLFFILLVANTIVGILGLAVLILSIIFWVKIKQVEILILALFLLSLFMISVCSIGYFCVKHSRTTLIFYLSLYSLIMLSVIALGLILVFNRSVIIDSIISKMTDSQEIINEIKEFLDNNFNIIGISFICVGILLVSLYLLMQYRLQV